MYVTFSYLKGKTHDLSPVVDNAVQASLPVIIASDPSVVLEKSDKRRKTLCIMEELCHNGRYLGKLSQFLNERPILARIVRIQTLYV